MSADGLETLHAPPVYRNHPGRADMVYRDLCRVLSGRHEQVNWGGYRPADWQLLALMALPENEGVGPLAYRFLKAGGWPEAMPEAVRGSLEDTYYKTVAHNTLLLGELEKLLAGMDKAGIEVVLLKGAALSGRLYPDIGLRPMGDLDLLLAKSQIEKAGEVLQAHGYLPASHPPDLSPGFREDYQIEVHYHKAGSPNSLVELHWDLVGGESSLLQADLEWFYARLAPFENGSGRVAGAWTLNPDANLLFLAGHLMLKHWMLKQADEKHARLLWFYDVHALVEGQGDDIHWQSVYQAARDFQWDSAFLGTVYGALARFGRHDPSAYLASRISPLPAQSLTRARDIGLLADRKNYRFSRMKRSAAIRFFLLHFFPSPAYMRWRYQPNPVFLWPLYYPVRWFAGIRDGVLRLQGKGEVK